MKQKDVLKWYAKLLFAFGLILVSVSLIIHIKYDVFLNQYLAYSGTLTIEEHQYLKEKGTLTFGVDFNRKPYFFFDEESGEYSGLLKDYMDDIAEDMGVSIEYVDKKQYDIKESSYTRKVDITEIYFNEELRRNFSLSQSLYKTRGVMIANSDSELYKYMDMSSVNLGILENTFTEKDIEKGLPKDSHLNYVYVDSIEDGIRELDTGNIDALAGNKNVIEKYSRAVDTASEQQILRNELYKGKVVLATDAYDTTLNNILNKEIMRLKKSSLYEHAQIEWLGSTYLDPEAGSIKWVGWILMLSVLLVVLLIIWETVLNQRIEETTHQIEVEKRSLQSVINNIEALVAVLNTDNVILQCNEYGKKMFANASENIIGTDIDEIEELKELKNMYMKDSEKPFYCCNDKYYRVSINPIGRKNDNKLLLMIGDCTDETIAEQKLRQESKMIAVGQLTAGLTHEIRNPLGLIKTYSYLLDEYANDEMSGHALNVINESVDRINTLIDNLLSFSRLSKDEPVSFNVTQMINHIIELGHKILEKANVNVIFDNTNEIIVTTLDESVKIVVYNLMNNCLEAFRENEQKDGVIILTHKTQNGILTITVGDNGPGMSEDTIESIFNPFFTTKDTGTGLGLYIVITELKKVNGQISVKSKLGKGTEFKVEIPILELGETDGK